MKSNFVDINDNLALEEALFSRVGLTQEIVLFLWRNDRSVIVGRNQNIYTECNLSEIKKQRCVIARRITGGGAVYHDLGNVNFSFIVPKNIYDIKKQLEIVKRALSKLEIDVCITGRNDLFIDEYKISGNAFYSNKNVGLHHGTILVNVDLDIMELVLGTSTGKMNKRGIKSVRNRVLNLSSINSSISCLGVMQSIEAEFINEYSNIKMIKCGIDEAERLKYLNKYKSDIWIYGLEREYDFQYEKQYSWGMLQCQILLVNMYEIKISIFSDSLFPELICSIEEGINADDDSIFQKLREKYENGFENKIINDIEKAYREIIFNLPIREVNSKNV